MVRSLIGMDEAGYGPNLGPLVVSATVWSSSTVADADLYELLDPWICADTTSSKARGRLGIADSKRLYRPPGGLESLELGVLAMLAATGRELPLCWREVWSIFDVCSGVLLNHTPWYAEYDERIPVACAPEQVLYWRDALQEAFAKSQTRLSTIASRVVCAREFNALLDRHGNKSNSLSHLTLELLRDVSKPCPSGEIHVECDKHGGRNRYAALLQHVFPESWIHVSDEGRASSQYGFQHTGRQFHVQFSANGERSLATALASMVSKYLRELAMRAFNHFWCRQVHGLKPTAGYPLDARRFQQKIAALQTQLGISDDWLWRAR